MQSLVFSVCANLLRFNCLKITYFLSSVACYRKLVRGFQEVVKLVSLLQIPEEEKNLGPHDRLIHVYHFMKDTTQNQVVSKYIWKFYLALHACCDL